MNTPPPFNDGLFSKDKGVLSSSAWRNWFKNVHLFLSSLSGGSGSPISPSSTVVSETSFSQSPNAGTALTFARGDHTHGTPSGANIPTTNEKAALVGTYGTPGAANKYVTDTDPRNSDARTPVAHAASHAPGASDYLTDYYATLKRTGVSSFPYTVQMDDNFLSLTGYGEIQVPDPAVYGNRTFFIEGGSGGTVTVKYGSLVIASYVAPTFMWISSDGVSWDSGAVQHAHAHSAIGGDPISHTDIADIGTNSHTTIDSQLPSSDQKAALAGTDGTPSATNKYVTDSDDRLPGETFETAAFATAASGTETKTVTFTGSYGSIPKVLLSYNNSVGTVFSEDFESYTPVYSLLGTGDGTWTMRFATATGTFNAVTGVYGEIKDSSGVWASITSNDSSLTSLTNYELSVDVVSYPGGRAGIGGRITSSGGYWLQCIPGSELRLYKSTSWDALTGSTQLAQWDASSPATLTSLGLVFNGTTITVKANGATIGSHTDSSYSNGTIGLYAYGSGGWNCDNILVTNIAGAETVIPIISAISTTQVSVRLNNLDTSLTATGKVQGLVIA